jgi:hypothetical protein
MDISLKLFLFPPNFFIVIPVDFQTLFLKNVLTAAEETEAFIICVLYAHHFIQ